MSTPDLARPPGPGYPPEPPLDFFRLPVEPDDGLPQAFGCLVGSTAYDFGLYARLAAPADDPPQTLYDLAAPGPITTPAAPPGYLVLRAVRNGPDGPRVVFLRKLVVEPGLVHHAGQLAIRLQEARIARGNLNGPGHFGSRIVIGVAQRWA